MAATAVFSLTTAHGRRGRPTESGFTSRPLRVRDRRPEFSSFLWTEAIQWWFARKIGSRARHLLPTAALCISRRRLPVSAADGGWKFTPQPRKADHRGCWLVSPHGGRPTFISSSRSFRQTASG